MDRGIDCSIEAVAPIHQGKQRAKLNGESLD